MRTSTHNNFAKKSSQPKKTSKLTFWPSTIQERNHLYEKYSSQRGFSSAFLDIMVKREIIFKDISRHTVTKTYLKVIALGREGLITKRLFPYFLKFLPYFSDIWKVFEIMDDEKMNKLSKDKFLQYRNSIEKDMIKSMDKDGTGNVSFDEFCNWAIEQEIFRVGRNNKEFFEINNKEFEGPAEDSAEYVEEKKFDTDDAMTFHSLDDLNEPKLDSNILIDSELTGKITNFYNEFKNEIQKEFKNLKENFNLKTVQIEDCEEEENQKKNALAEINALNSYQKFMKFSLETMKKDEKRILEMERLKNDLIQKNRKAIEDYQFSEEKLKNSLEQSQIEILKKEKQIKSLLNDSKKRMSESKILIEKLKTKEEAILTLSAQLDTIKINHSKEIEIIKKILIKNVDEASKHEIQALSEKLKLYEEKFKYY